MGPRWCTSERRPCIESHIVDPPAGIPARSPRWIGMCSIWRLSSRHDCRRCSSTFDKRMSFNTLDIAFSCTRFATLIACLFCGDDEGFFFASTWMITKTLLLTTFANRTAKNESKTRNNNKNLIWRRKKLWASTVRNNNDSHARDKTLKQLSIAILQFVVFTSQFHLIYLTLSSSLLMRFWIHFLFLSVLIIISYSFSSFRGLISSSPAWLPSDWASEWREFTSWPKLGCDKNLSALGLYLFYFFFAPHDSLLAAEQFSPSPDALIA